ncbi:hypothetical protein ACCD10_14820 [Pseudomonas sp. Pseusp122]|uniref:hypothetical protein n=1 Tax=unclassified Pseudomonas TaxID=196821 RepID=UPI0039A7281A
MTATQGDRQLTQNYFSSVGVSCVFVSLVFGQGFLIVTTVVSLGLLLASSIVMKRPLTESLPRLFTLAIKAPFLMADSTMNSSPESIQTRNQLSAGENSRHEKATAQPDLRGPGVHGNLAPIAIGPPGLILSMESHGLSEKFAPPF